MQYSEHRVTATDSQQLFVRHYSPPSGVACGRTLFIVHGTSEHGGRYRHVAEVAVSQGWDVICPDLRGHGHSDGIAVHVERFDQYLQDFDTLWRFFEVNPDRTALLGHSFGGLVSARFAQTRPSKLAALVLMSPLLGLRVKIDPLTYALGRTMSYVAPRTRFKSKVPPGSTCRCPEVLQRRDTDPLIHRSVTARWFFEMKRALRDVAQDAPRLRASVLAFQAGADLIVAPEAVEPWLQTVGTDDREFRMFAGHYHELLNEPTWPDTLAALLNWLAPRLACVPTRAKAGF